MTMKKNISFCKYIRTSCRITAKGQRFCKSLIIFIFFISAHDNLFSYAKGPLWSKNAFPTFLLFMNLPGDAAVIDKPGNLRVGSSIYYSQGWSPAFDFELEEIYRVADFEGMIFEVSSSYSFNRMFQVGMTFRLISYYGGLMDGFTHMWHDLFRLPNGGREFFPQNEVYIDMKTENGFNLYLDKPSAGFGDIDTWFKFNFLTNRFIAASAIHGFKIPSGMVSNITGSGYPDLLLGLLLDFYPVKFFSIYLQAAGVIPVHFKKDSAPIPAFNGIIAFELSPIRIFSIVTQFNIKTSHLKGNDIIYNNLGMLQDLISSPQANLLVGLVFNINKFRLQIFFEEDTFFNAGTDYTASISLSRDIKLF